MDVLFETTDDTDESPMIIPYVMLENVYDIYDQYDIITQLAFQPNEKYIYIVLYDSPTELMLTTLYTIIPELNLCIVDQPYTSFMFQCQSGTNKHITLSLAYLCPIQGKIYELIVRTLHYYHDIKLIRTFMEDRKKRIYQPKDVL